MARRKKTQKNTIGAWAFLIGVILALVIGVFDTNPITLSLLVILGILVGVFNVTNEESSRFLLASVSLVFVAHFGGAAIGALSGVELVGDELIGILNALVLLFVPTTIIVALKSIFEIAKE